MPRRSAPVGRFNPGWSGLRNTRNDTERGGIREVLALTGCVQHLQPPKSCPGIWTAAACCRLPEAALLPPKSLGHRGSLSAGASAGAHRRGIALKRSTASRLASRRRQQASTVHVTPTGLRISKASREHSPHQLPVWRKQTAGCGKQTAGCRKRTAGCGKPLNGRGRRLKGSTISWGGSNLRFGLRPAFERLGCGFFSFRSAWGGAGFPVSGARQAPGAGQAKSRAGGTPRIEPLEASRLRFELPMACLSRCCSPPLVETMTGGKAVERSVSLLPRFPLEGAHGVGGRDGLTKVAGAIV